MCEFYDPRVAGACREPIAEEVKDKERSNFCDYFKARADAYRPQNDTTARDARAKLDALFGTGPSREEESRERGSGPSAMTTRQCRRDQGKASRQAGMLVRIIRACCVCNPPRVYLR